MPDQFKTITGADWKRNLAEARVTPNAFAETLRKIHGANQLSETIQPAPTQEVGTALQNSNDSEL